MDFYISKLFLIILSTIIAETSIIMYINFLPIHFFKTIIILDKKSCKLNTIDHTAEVTPALNMFIFFYLLFIIFRVVVIVTIPVTACQYQLASTV